MAMAMAVLIMLILLMAMGILLVSCPTATATTQSCWAPPSALPTATTTMMTAMPLTPVLQLQQAARAPSLWRCAQGPLQLLELQRPLALALPPRLVAVTAPALLARLLRAAALRRLRLPVALLLLLQVALVEDRGSLRWTRAQRTTRTSRPQRQICALSSHARPCDARACVPRSMSRAASLWGLACTCTATAKPRQLQLVLQVRPAASRCCRHLRMHAEMAQQAVLVLVLLLLRL